MFHANNDHQKSINRSMPSWDYHERQPRQEEKDKLMTQRHLRTDPTSCKMVVVTAVAWDMRYLWGVLTDLMLGQWLFGFFLGLCLLVFASDHFLVLPLHSMLPTANQRQVRMDFVDHYAINLLSKYMQLSRLADMKCILFISFLFWFCIRRCLTDHPLECVRLSWPPA